MSNRESVCVQYIISFLVIAESNQGVTRWARRSILCLRKETLINLHYMCIFSSDKPSCVFILSEEDASIPEDLCPCVSYVSVRISINSLWVLQGSICWFRIVDKEDGHGLSCLSPFCWVCVCQQALFWFEAGKHTFTGRPSAVAAAQLCRSQMMNNVCWEISTAPSLPEREKERARTKEVPFEGEQNVSLKQRILSVLCLCLKQNGLPL